MCECMHICRIRRKIADLILSIFGEGSWDRVQVMGLGNRDFNQMSLFIHLQVVLDRLKRRMKFTLSAYTKTILLSNQPNVRL